MSNEKTNYSTKKNQLGSNIFLLPHSVTSSMYTYRYRQNISRYALPAISLKNITAMFWIER